jgi:hypothetical protein
VRIEESRPLSATKRWRLVEVIQRAGDGAFEPVVGEEEATSEAIHAAAHPGRTDRAATLAEGETAPGADKEPGAGIEAAATEPNDGAPEETPA